MIRMSKMTDYGIVLMASMARAEGARTARQLAAEAELPLPTVAKVLKVLARQNFLVSTRGVNGGYHLKHAAEQIRISDLIEALEGPIALTECSVPASESGCSHEQHCPLRAPWLRINNVVKNALADIYLADMASPSLRLPEVDA